MRQIAEALASIRVAGLYRDLSRPKTSTRESSGVTASGLLDFSSNDYLGLSRSEEIRGQLIDRLRSGCLLGGTGSRLLADHSDSHYRCEEFLAKLYAVPSALLFGSGYLANLGVMGALGSVGAEFFSDQLNHASLIDGMKLSKAKTNVYAHNDLAQLQEKLGSSSAALKVIVTESVFSQDGDFAPVKDLVAIARHSHACLVVDEAHATGVFGPRGLGCLDGDDLSSDQVISIHTGGKALGAHGAFVLSSREIRQLLINRARTFIYSTAISPLSAHHIELALTAVTRDSAPRNRLMETSIYFRRQLGFESGKVKEFSQIVPIILGTNERVLAAQAMIQSVGFDVRAIRSPTVPPGTERLRISLKSFHDQDDVRALAKIIREKCLA